MDGEQISADQIAEVAKWPTRTEQLSLLLGQILSVGSRLNGQLIAVGGALASQISEKAKGGEEEAAEGGPAEAVAGRQSGGGLRQRSAAGWRTLHRGGDSCRMRKYAQADGSCMPIGPMRGPCQCQSHARCLPLNNGQTFCRD